MTCNCNSNKSGFSEVSSTPCVSPTTPCMSNQPPRTRCDCARPESGPTPYYHDIQGCQEDHTLRETHERFLSAFSSASTFVMPGCDAQVTVYFVDMMRITVGGYLWSPQTGYLRVDAFDASKPSVIVTNLCQVGNAAPGTLIPACTDFLVVDPPYEASSTDCGEGPFVTANFVVPILGNTVDVQVNTTAGLTLYAIVQVGVGVYKLVAILTPNLIQLRNEGGAGLVPGSTIIVKDALGNCLCPITPYGQDPCLEPAISSGSLVVCDGGGKTTTLNATMPNQVPVCTDANTNAVEFKDVHIEIPECTSLTACVALSSIVNTYTFEVFSTAGFTQGNVIFLSYTSIDTTLFVITAIPDGIHITVSVLGTAPNVACVPIGTPVCHAYCCDQVLYDLALLAQRVMNPCNENWGYVQLHTAETAITLPAETATVHPTDTFSAVTKTVTISNPTCNSMGASIDINYRVRGYFDANEGARIRTVFTPYFGFSLAALPGPPAAPLQGPVIPFKKDIVVGAKGNSECTSYNSYDYWTYHYHYLIPVPAGQMIRVDAHLDLEYLKYLAGTDGCCPCQTLGSDGSGDLSIEEAVVEVWVTGTAVQGA